MENIIDQDYAYTMRMDVDEWLVRGGYKSFNYLGKLPYISVSHTELLRIGSLDVDKGWVWLAVPCLVPYLAAFPCFMSHIILKHFKPP